MKLLDGNELWVEIYKLEHKRKWKNRTNIAFRECLNVIQFFPKVDAEPVKHGRWIDVNGDGSLWRCSLCEETQCCKSNYCGDCGAKMDEAEE